MYQAGRGVPGGQDLHMAMELYAKAARQGDSLGQYHYGLLLRDMGGKVQCAQARIMFERAASQGVPEAMVAYGNMCETGEGCTKMPQTTEYRRAFQLYHKAAQLGLPSAHLFCGKAYMTGKGVSSSYDLAHASLMIAAQHRVAGAAEALRQLETNARISPVTGRKEIRRSALANLL
mmetsp:Transcript_2279/g.3791  ORF Transcript_2279/g.3791 Transcript_2279/m.3791 type:complete len:176 (+) Transcript_2279:351-878(+)